MININEAHNTGRSALSITQELDNHDIEYRIIFQPSNDIMCKIGDVYLAIHFDDEWVAL